MHINSLHKIHQWVATVPLDEKEMDKIFDLRCKFFLWKMETGKFYSYSELKHLILTGSLHRPQLPNDDKANAILDVAYAEAVIQAQYAVGNLIAAEKEGQRYYSKK